MSKWHGAPRMEEAEEQPLHHPKGKPKRGGGCLESRSEELPSTAFGMVREPINALALGMMNMIESSWWVGGSNYLIIFKHKWNWTERMCTACF